MSTQSPLRWWLSRDHRRRGTILNSGKGGGGPPPLATAALSHLAAGWPALADLRAAASARRGSGRLRNEISALVCDVRVALAAAFLGGLPDSDGVSSQQAAEDAQGAAASRSVASRVYSDARTLLVDCGPALRSHWHLSDDQWRELRTALESVVGPSAVAGPDRVGRGLGCPLSSPRPAPTLRARWTNATLTANTTNLAAPSYRPRTLRSRSPVLASSTAERRRRFK